MNKYCPEHKVLICRDEVKFCSVCGKELREVEKCEFCNHELNPMGKFCDFCGRPVD